jgi:uncharacterized protein with FMN-binding domain
MARKLNPNLIAIGSAAIVGIYAVGYAQTQSSSGQAGASIATAAPTAAAALARPPASTSNASSSVNAPAATAIARSIATAPAAAAPSSPQRSASNSAGNTSGSAANGAAAAAATYRDGTFTGSGTSRRGDVTVSLSVQDGKISAVQITRATTYYPTSRISRLPGQVVDRQSAQIDYVSGATDSSIAFRQAVTNALNQARATAPAAAAPAG